MKRHIIWIGIIAIQLIATESGFAKDKNLYERLGKKTAIQAVANDFIDRAIADPNVNFVRSGQPRAWDASPANVKRIKAHLVDLLCKVTGGPDRYRGRNMKAAHVGMRISEEEFTALAGDLVATLDKFHVQEKEKQELLSIVASTKGEIVEGQNKMSSEQ